jgi:hypothetical protein
LAHLASDILQMDETSTVKGSLELSPFFRGRLCKLSHALLSECAKFIRHFSPALNIKANDISGARKRINFTKKKLSRINTKRNPVQRERWWTSPAPQGVLDVLRELLVGIDEMGVVLYSAEREFGHSLKGTKAVALSRSQREKLTVILTISPRGVVCWDMYTTDIVSDFKDSN